ncbi:pheromone-processing carboxypeptidase KEX1 [Artemisia annua]|uniref:Pheromone-processing carboxypeptidase KEX1 n=1 Tax=Artemisia annua TaxID=35608 RepID=A0A2U1KAG5_ARTAN|nr:pheromone-processing carboxypeptidase KEX1 [Artemisia annua]
MVVVVMASGGSYDGSDGLRWCVCSEVYEYLASSKYSEALALCPVRSKKERVVLYSNRAQCYLLLQQPLGAISHATRALCLHNSVNRHAKSHGGEHRLMICWAEDGNVYGQESDDSEWETASESDVGDDGRKEMSNNKEGNVD